MLEIGPGPGGLTRALIAEGAARVIAVERDERAIAALGEIAAHYPGRLQIVAGDALTFDIAPYLGGGPIRIVANLPYNIATALLVGVALRRAVAALVRPARRSCFSARSPSVSWRSPARRPTAGSPCWRAGAREAKILFDIAPSAFVPPPKVTSSRGPACAARNPLPCDRRALERVTEAAFGQRRKMLRQSLKQLGPIPFRCSKKQASTRRRARRILRSKASSPWPTHVPGMPGPDLIRAVKRFCE